MRFKNGKKRDFRKILPFLIFLGIVFLSAGFLKIFSVKESNLKFINTPCEESKEIKKVINLDGKNIFFLNTDVLKESIKNKFICIEDLQVRKNLPNKIEVTLKSREPLINLNYYKLSTPSGVLNLKDLNVSSQSSKLNIPEARLKFGKSVFLDQEGIVISTQSAKKVIYKADFIGDEPKFLTKMGDFIKISIEIMEGLKKISIPQRKVLIVQDKFLIFYSNPDVIFSLSKDPKEQVTSLQLILEQAKMNSNQSNQNTKESKDIIKIDLRYDKPVITFSK